jgi:hypothetical protein
MDYTEADKRAAVLAAYRSLSPEDREQVDIAAEAVINRVKSRCSKMQMGHDMALEVIASVGMYLIKSGG